MFHIINLAVLYINILTLFHSFSSSHVMRMVRITHPSFTSMPHGNTIKILDIKNKILNAIQSCIKNNSKQDTQLTHTNWGLVRALESIYTNQNNVFSA